MYCSRTILSQMAPNEILSVDLYMIAVFSSKQKYR